jgi:hypothetical protein
MACYGDRFILFLLFYQYIEQIVHKIIQWHVDVCSVALLCNW